MNDRDDAAPQATTSEEAAPEKVVITREGLADGSLLARIRAQLLPGMIVRTDAEIAASLDRTLAAHDPAADIWVFGYGSLMWNPAFAYAECQVGIVRGWHRRFCLWLEMGRGTPDNPGLMLGLDRGGTCRGVAFRIPAAQARGELSLIWQREMFGTVYIARWVQVRLAGAVVPAITFVVDRTHPRYATGVSDADAARYIASATGALGSCFSYFDSTVRHLDSLGIRDAGLRRIADAIASRP